jgi:hypothetical protein
MDGWTVPVAVEEEDEICSLAEMFDAAREGFFWW